MNDFRSRLALVMAEKNIKAAELSRLTGISKPRLSQYKNGVYVPKADAICAIARALGVSEAYLLGTTDIPEARSGGKYKVLPVVGQIACGYPVFASEEDGGTVYTDADTDADFCLIAKGDSMKDARINSGDTVFIKKADTVNNGEIAAIIINDEATLKRVYYYPESSKLMLISENSNYEPMVYSGDELEKIRIIGKAVAFKSEIR
ncbi:MAG: helix-turn-helix domain-containing protein [Ruminococcaceae bacterium]|nr:helix-turn-helix domain-containing protein [Oscillospiraceae bacterium]